MISKKKKVDHKPLSDHEPNILISNSISNRDLAELITKRIHEIGAMLLVLSSDICSGVGGLKANIKGTYVTAMSTKVDELDKLFSMYWDRSDDNAGTKMETDS